VIKGFESRYLEREKEIDERCVRKKSSARQTAKSKLRKEVLIIFVAKTGKEFLVPPNSKGNPNHIYLIILINIYP
jgi:hypothetical protein